LGKIELVIKRYRIFRENIKGKTRRGLKNSLKRFKFQAMKKRRHDALKLPRCAGSRKGQTTRLYMQPYPIFLHKRLFLQLEPFIQNSTSNKKV